MLGKLKELIRYSPLTSIPIVVFVVLLSATLNIYSAKVEGDQMTEFRDKLEKQQRKEEWNQISTIIKASYATTKQNSKYIAQKIELDLVKQYSDLEVLRSEFETETFSPEFYKIFEDNLFKDSGSASSIYPLSFHTSVGLKDGIIAIFSNKINSNVKNDSQAYQVDWDTYVESNPNPSLAKEAITSVLEHNSDVIFIQMEESEQGDLEENEQMTMNTLKKAYMKYGIEGLQYYNLLSPSYITDSGDIFNTDDNTFMKKNKNYKMIILQSFNIGDILGKYDRVIYDQKKNSASNITFLDNTIETKYLIAILTSFILFMISLLLVNVYNAERRRIDDPGKYPPEGDRRRR